jgi:hypothetical protein
MAFSNTVSFQNPSDFSAETEANNRRMQMAQALLLQSQKSAMPTGGMVGDRFVPPSWTQQLSSALEGPMASYKLDKTEETAKDIGNRQRQAYAAELAQYGKLMNGTPGQTIQPNTPNDDEGNPMPAAQTPAVPGDTRAAGQFAMGAQNPMLQQFGIGQMQADIKQQQLAAMLKQFGISPGGQPGQPTQPGQPVAPGQPQGQGALSGVNPLAMALTATGDPTMGKIGEMAQTAYADQNKPQNVRPGGTIAQRDPVTGQWKQGYYSPVLGEGVANTPTGAATVVPGYTEAQAAVGRAPLEKVQNSDQTFSYIPKSQLAQDSLPRPVETPGQLSNAGQTQLPILMAERAKQAQTGQVDPQLEAEIANAQKRASGQYPTGGPVASGLGGPRKFGQTQAEQIQQAGQTASNTEAGKEFVAEMRQNYAKLRDVPATLENMERAKTLAASQAKDFMGPLGQSKLAVTKFLRSNVPGMSNLDTSGVTSAEELQSTLFNQVMDNLKKMDASPSQYQQQVMQEAFGTLKTDPQSVPKILDVFQDILRNRVNLHNQTVKSAESRGTAFPYDISVNLKPKAGTGKAKFLGFE